MRQGSLLLERHNAASGEGGAYVGKRKGVRPELPAVPGPATVPATPGKPAHANGNGSDSDERRANGRSQERPEHPVTESIVELGSMHPPPQPGDGIQVLTIIGQVEGHVTLPAQNKTTKYEHLIPQLTAIEQSEEAKGLLVILNTVGGDVEAGLAIAEMLATLSKPTVSLVLGGGHSIGVPISVACDYSFIAPTATMTIHPIRLTGLVIGVPQTYEYLDKMQDRVVRFVVSHTKMTEAEFRDLMFRTGELARDIGTVLVGEDAVKRGLIDAVGGIGDAVAKLKELIRERAEASGQAMQAALAGTAQAGAGAHGVPGAPS